LDSGTVAGRDLGIVDQSIVQTIDQSVDRTIDQSIDKTVDLSMDQTIDQSIDKTIDLSVDKSMDQLADLSTDVASTCVGRDQSCVSVPCCAPAICIDSVSGRICAESSLPRDGSPADGKDTATGVGDGPTVDVPVAKDVHPDTTTDTVIGTDALVLLCGVAVTGSCVAGYTDSTKDQCTDYTAVDLSVSKSTCINASSYFGTWSDNPCQNRFSQGCLRGTPGQPGCYVTWAKAGASFATQCVSSGGTSVLP
jgi:hypothetical protein